MHTIIEKLINEIRYRLGVMNIDMPLLVKDNFVNLDDHSLDCFHLITTSLIQKILYYEDVHDDTLQGSYLDPFKFSTDRGLYDVDLMSTMKYLQTIDFLVSELQFSIIAQKKHQSSTTQKCMFNTIDNQISSLTKYFSNSSQNNIYISSNDILSSLLNYLYSSTPLLLNKNQYTNSMISYINILNNQLAEDTFIRKQLLYQRLEVTLLSLTWSKKQYINEIQTIINMYKQQFIPQLNILSLDSIFQARINLLSSIDEACHTVQTPLSVTNYKMGPVPSRGGKVDLNKPIKENTNSSSSSHDVSKSQKRVFTNDTKNNSYKNKKGMNHENDQIEYSKGDKSKRNRNLCQDFINGYCKYGRRCRLVHHPKEPAAWAGIALGITAFVMPVVVVPIRRRLGLPTNQYSNKAYIPQIPKKLD
ncbi:hypothetical protein WA158_004150 [Blastocystis sp. Blastoise]